VRASVPPRFALCRLHTASHGFSLVELLVTLVLVVIVAVMLFGFSSKSHQQRQKAACANNLQTLYVALQMFANENAGSFPVLTNAHSSDEPLSVLVPQFTSISAPFICPGSKDKKLPEGEPIEGRRISYAYYMGRRITDAAEPVLTDAQVDASTKIEGRPVFSVTGKPPGNNHYRYGGNYLFCDGRTESGSAIAPFSLVLTQGVVLLNPRQP
jgi:prepilin-type N-terminal cleavage/methylation domain-containing protein/prepilin-type processing-associated H-X9-DG protein